MMNFTVAVFALVLAGTASAGWRDLRVDGSSDEAFARSMAAFKDELSLRHEYVFGEALKDIWNEGAKAAEAEQREYTADEFYRQLDGLRYEEIVTITDPTGDTAKRRYRIAYVACCAYAASPQNQRRSATGYASYPNAPRVPSDTYWFSNSGVPRGSTTLFGSRASQ